MQEKSPERAAATSSSTDRAVHGVAVQYLIAAEAVLAAEGHIPVKGKDGADVGEHPLVPSGGHKQLDPPLPQGVEGGANSGRNGVGLKADQRAVHVEENGFCHGRGSLSYRVAGERDRPAGNSVLFHCTVLQAGFPCAKWTIPALCRDRDGINGALHAI